MAPILQRPFVYSDPTPRPPKGASTTPVPVTRYISLRVLLELFTGTICIFILAVLFWKIGQFFRFLTQDKVLREGKNTTTRYARTWYGWVPLERHEANKKIIQNCFEKLRGWTAWRSSRADFRWVWWDPGQKELESYKQKRKSLRWLPKCFRSYSFTVADTIWTPGPPIRQNFLPGDNIADCSASMTGTVPSHDVLKATPGRRKKLSNKPEVKELRESFNMDSPRKNRTLPQGTYLTSQNCRRFLSLNQPAHLHRGDCFILFPSDYNAALQGSLSLPCLLNTETAPPRLPEPSDQSWDTESTKHEFVSGSIRLSQYRFRKYQVWSARMELQTSKCVRYNQRTLLGPPGSPKSELLASISSDQGTFLGSFHKIQRSIISNSSSDSTSHALSTFMLCCDQNRSKLANNEVHGIAARRWQSSPFVCNPSVSYQYRDAMHGSGHEAHAPLGMKITTRPLQSKISMRPREGDRKGKIRPGKNRKLENPAQKPVPIGSLSNWEIRLMDDLNRRVEWLFDQLSPGRTFHFAMLANHWLNRETWIVIDPISRVSSDARRQWGDPRFNIPYPTPRWEPRQKFPGVPPKAARTPRIDSWRAAVNKHRRVSGLKDVIKGTKLYDGSADEPPDGKVDPASWILPRPPQGFGLSNKQKNAYYEGGAGWHEKLSDWQKVRRGYRIRKAIHEGRANRTRAKELAMGISRYYGTASFKIFGS